MREAHQLDGVAMAKFLHWFDDEAPKGELTEIGIVTALESLPARGATRWSTSASTPSRAPAPNGAIVHYRVDQQDRPQAEAGRTDAGRLAAGST